MVDLPIRVERLPSMTVASVRAFGTNPEAEAWDRLKRWADEHGFLQEMNAHPVYGFNNPPPEEGRREHGYEMWMRVDPDTDDGQDVSVKRIAGGRYVVARCKLHGDPRGSVRDVWMSLYEWIGESGSLRWRRTHELERHLGPPDDEDLELELYLPVED